MALSGKERKLIRWLWSQTNDACQDDSTFETDGGAGSGNWGHKGRPGKRGGSGEGGGKKYRSGSKEEGYTQKKLDDPVAASSKYTTSGSSLTRGSGAQFSPKTKAPAAPKAESAAVAGLRETIGRNTRAAATRLDRLPAGTEISYSDGKNEYKLTKQPDQYGVPGNWVGTRNGKYDQATAQDLAYSLKQNGGKFDVREAGGQTAQAGQTSAPATVRNVAQSESNGVETVSATTSSDPYAKSLAKIKTAEGVKKAVNGLLQTKQGSFFVDGRGQGYFVGFDNKLHSSDGIVVQPWNKSEMAHIAEIGLFRGDGALVSEMQMDKNATRSLLDAKTVNKAIASMPMESRIMVPPSSTYVKTENGWVDTTRWHKDDPAKSDAEMVQRISDIVGFGNPDALESKGFITRSNEYPHPHPFAAFVPSKSHNKNTDSRGLTELESW